MIAVDTSVLVRLLTADDPKQTAAAQHLFASESIWISKTVLLETVWVLRSSYRFEENAIRDALIKLMGLKNMHTEDETAIATTLALTGHGIDFADALHLSSRPSGAVFVSFDQSLVRRAKRAGVAEVSELTTK